jgi:signal transduction histidine kinase
LVELIGNAVEVMELSQSPRRAITFRIGAERGKGRTRLGNVIIEVCDSGPGIVRADKSSVFQPFFTKKFGSSTGLGLAIVRQVFEGHHGSIAEEGEHGQGARFVIRLPRATRRAS